MRERPVLSNSPVLDERWGVAERAAASTAFRRSSRSRELLVFICERALVHNGADLHEQDIGCGVFGRQPNYNSGDDNIVRVEMRLLRKRLDEYFRSEGKDEPFAIVVPKGTYVPVFTRREATAPAPSPSWRQRFGRWLKFGPWFKYVQPAIILLLLTACLWIWQDRRALARAANGTGRGALWPLLFDGSRQTLVVCADSTLVIAENVLGHSISLDQYLSRDYLKPSAKDNTGASGVLASLAYWNFTDIADTRLVQQISRLNGEYWSKARVRSARTAELDDFKAGNIILLGSARSSPWVHLFDPVLEFQVEYDGRTRNSIVRNRSPRPGEQDTYRWEQSGGSGEAYCALSFLPNLRGTGNVLIIAGTVGDSTEATGEFITNPATSSGLWSDLIVRNHGRLPYFEVLLKFGTLHGVAKTPEVVALRILPGSPS